MKQAKHISAVLALALSLPLAFIADRASAFELAVSNYGNSTSAWPQAVAYEGGFYKKEGLDISGVRGSTGGTGEVRAMLAGDLPYITSSLDAVLSAIKQGADLKIVSENVHTSSTFTWVVMPDSPIKSINDLKGKRISFTTPQSTSEMLDRMLLSKAGLSATDATLVAAGPQGAAMTLLEHGGLDVVALSEPTYTMVGSKYRAIASAADLFPPIDSNLSVSSAKEIKEHPEIIRGILAANAKAVDYMSTNRKESAVLIGKVYKLAPEVVETVLARIIDHGATQGVPYWGHGEINAADIDNLVTGFKMVGVLKDDAAPWRSAVDQSLLPDSLKRDLK